MKIKLNSGVTLTFRGMNYFINTMPEYHHLLVWHKCNCYGPYRYLDRVRMHASDYDLDAARLIARWPDATYAELMDSDLLPLIQLEFLAVMSSTFPD